MNNHNQLKQKFEGKWVIKKGFSPFRFFHKSEPKLFPLIKVERIGEHVCVVKIINLYEN
jgi:hypothetical protein